MKNILHIIDSLNTGGAELLLVKIIPALQEGFKHTIVYLKKPDPLLEELKGYDVIFLDYKGKYSLPATVIQLRKIIVQKQINIVHSHLFFSTILARLACPKSVKLIFHVHNVLSDDAFKHNFLTLIVEKVTYKADQTAIFVSETVKEDYEKFVGLKGKCHVLYNFVDEAFFRAAETKPVSWHYPVKLVTVGNLKNQKNYHFLINAFSQLKDSPVLLDIYGEGTLRAAIIKHLETEGITNVKLKGFEKDIFSNLSEYDIFIAASKFEGFCIAVAEAMAIGLPCILSDIKTFREITAGNAVFFNLEHEQDLVQKIKELPGLQDQLLKNANQLVEKAHSFKQAIFIKKLTDIYNEKG